MKKYCIDTSGLSNPLESMPQDIHSSMWVRVFDILGNGSVAVTREIFDEMVHIDGGVGDFIKDNAKNLVLEVGEAGWDSVSYISCSTKMIADHHDFISEYIGGSRKTVCLADISIVALAKSLNVPVVSMEKRVGLLAKGKRKIPDICDIEGVRHMDFSDLLRAENFKN